MSAGGLGALADASTKNASFFFDVLPYAPSGPIDKHTF